MQDEREEAGGRSDAHLGGDARRATGKAAQEVAEERSVRGDRDITGECCEDVIGGKRKRDDATRSGAMVNGGWCVWVWGIFSFLAFPFLYTCNNMYVYVNRHK